MRRVRRVFWMMRPPEVFRADYLILSLLFILGVVGGQLAGGLIRTEEAAELSGYLQSHSQAISARQGPSPAAVVFAYFRLPALLIGLSLVPWGAWLILPLAAAHGFLLSMTVRCMTAALGRGGVSVALAALGIRCCFVLPCCFYLASLALPFSGKGRRFKPASGNEEKRRRLILSAVGCAAVLLLGCAAEISLVPRLFAWALGHIT